MKKINLIKSLMTSAVFTFSFLGLGLFVNKAHAAGTYIATCKVKIGTNRYDVKGFLGNEESYSLTMAIKAAGMTAGAIVKPHSLATVRIYSGASSTTMTYVKIGTSGWQSYRTIANTPTCM